MSYDRYIVNDTKLSAVLLKKIDYDSCSSNPCRNNGNCTNIESNEYECTCIPGLTGKNCELGKKCGNEPNEFNLKKLYYL